MYTTHDKPLAAELIDSCGSSRMPLAAPGLTSYRYRGRYGWIMIGANGHADALREAARSTDDPVTLDRLEIWSGPAGYVPVTGLTVVEHSWDDFEHVVMEGN